MYFVFFGEPVAITRVVNPRIGETVNGIQQKHCGYGNFKVVVFHGHDKYLKSWTFVHDKENDRIVK